MMIRQSKDSTSSAALGTVRTSPTDSIQKLSKALLVADRSCRWKVCTKFLGMPRGRDTTKGEDEHQQHHQQQEIKKKLLHSSSRKAMLEIIEAQESTIEHMSDLISDYHSPCCDREGDLERMQQLYAESEALAETLTAKVNNATEQLAFTRGEVKRLRKKTIQLEEENYALKSSNIEVSECCAMYRFRHETEQVEEFPSLCPVDDTLLESDTYVGDYKLLETLGEGNMGTVISARSALSEDELAIKKIDKKYLYEYYFIRQLDLEVSALRSCREHPNINQLKETMHSPKNFYLVLEKGWIDVHAYSQIECLSELTIREIMIGLFRALEFVHARSFAHLDVKPDNILLTFPSSGIVTSNNVRLCDFGLCMHSAGSPAGTVLGKGGEVIGTTNFFAPELVLAGEVYDAVLADVWSSGASLMELAFGFPNEWLDAYKAFRRDDGYNLVDTIYGLLDELRDVFDIGEASTLSDLLINHILVRPDERKNSTNVMSHKWFMEENPSSTKV